MVKSPILVSELKDASGKGERWRWPAGGGRTSSRWLTLPSSSELTRRACLGLSGDWLWQRGGDLLHWAGTANLVSVMCSGWWLFSYSFYLKFWNVLPQYLGRDHLMCGGTDQSVFRFSIEIVTRQIFAMLNHLIQGDWFEEEEDSGKY